MYRSKFLVTLLAAASLVVHWSTSPITFAQEEQFSVDENNLAAAVELERPGSVDLFEIPMGDFVTSLVNETGLQFMIHESAKENGLDAATPITLSLNDTRRATILNLLLEPFRCTYKIEDGIVLLVSLDHATLEPPVAVIDCSELLSTITPEQVLQQRPSTRRQPGGLGGGVFGLPPSAAIDPAVQKHEEPSGDSSDERKAANPEPDVNRGIDNAAPLPERYYVTRTPQMRLIDLIQETIDPSSWEKNGGNCRIDELNGKLIIVQTSDNLRKIRELLKNLQ